MALAAVCFFWGTTYLAIRMSLESFAPLVLVALRFTTSGTLLLLFARSRGMHLPGGRELAAACFSGVLVLGIGNTALTFAELAIPSGIAGLILTMSPFWMVGVEAMRPDGEPLHAPAIGGMLLGLSGACLLVLPDLKSDAVDHQLLNGFLVLQLGMAGWSFGSIYQRRQMGKTHPVIAGAVQQVAAGLAAVPFIPIFHQHPIHWTFRGAAALLYLICFGSIVGYSAYIYAMDRLPVALVSVYSYVNAIVAVALGWLFYREPFGLREGVAMLVIFAAVGVVKHFSLAPKH